MDKRSLGILLGAAAMLATSGLTWADASSSAVNSAAPAPAPAPDQKPNP